MNRKACLQIKKKKQKLKTVIKQLGVEVTHKTQHPHDKQSVAKTHWHCSPCPNSCANRPPQQRIHITGCPLYFSLPSPFWVSATLVSFHLL